MTTRSSLALQGLPPGDAALWERIADEMTKRIESGLWASGQKLLAETELAAELGVARGTLRRAIKELCDSGYLVQRHGLGTFVAKRQSSPLAHRMESLGERMSRAGLAFETRELSRRVVEDGIEHGIDGEPALIVRRARSVDGAPVAVLSNAVPLRAFPGIEEKDLTSRPLYTVLEEDYHAELLRAERTFRALRADDDVAGLLDLSPGDPVLNFVQITFGPRDVVLDVAETWIRSDRHQPTVSMWRNV
ncbi:GntR family transcriptional regulator [Microbacterium sp. SORGH_AS_0888]|uniref:GntR family transcriptional regulator n=1 Tax=Microbacterium sp. SORGH_AS_0888 TaxID=3041791 RepID=UPI002788E5E4|nr:GntR family transcriptional regulator [Microbacterium sp. SORGH_AS_0888]MDQ1129485.1 DNA-binding GntR family transcriptional regulator [Microbacterium sp. SORGH_AS_0888]